MSAEQDRLEQFGKGDSPDLWPRIETAIPPDQPAVGQRWRTGRLVLLAAAVSVLAVGGIVAANSGGNDDSEVGTDVATSIEGTPTVPDTGVAKTPATTTADPTSTTAPQHSTAHVLVGNGSGLSGQANSLSFLLIEAGFTTDPTNAEARDESVVLYRNGYADHARRVAAVAGIDKSGLIEIGPGVRPVVLFFHESVEAGRIGAADVFVIIGADIAEPLPNGLNSSTGVLRIPTLDVVSHFVDGVTDFHLQHGPARFVGTPLPGQPGNAVLFGNRTTYDMAFGDLDQLVAGDDVTVVSTAGLATFQVVDKPTIVEADDLSVLDEDGPARLTLVANHPKFTDDQRIVVVAELVGEPTPAPPFVEDLREPSDRMTLGPDPAPAAPTAPSVTQAPTDTPTATSPPAVEIAVPDVIGLFQDSVIAQLQEVGLVVIKIEQGGEGRPQLVVRQEPVAGTLVPAGTTITIWVEGPTVGLD